ncbi:MAG: ABC transporter ATP-binding protein [Candidatus Thorarchaeota archaeon]|nr:ABC transporter ATP-binding protein [Candidatus Thorarchaeota archaeon]
MSNDELVLKVKNLYTNFYTYEGVVKALDGVNLFLRKGSTMGLVGETGCGKSVTARSILRLVEPPGRIEGGEVIFYKPNEETGEVEPIDLLQLPDEEMLHIRGKYISIVFQDPATFPNPVFTIGNQIAEVVMLHQDLRREAVETKIDEIKAALEQIKDDQSEKAHDRRESLTRQLKHFESLLDNPPEPDSKYKKKAALRIAERTLRLVKMPAPDKIMTQYPHELSGGMRQRALIAMALACNPVIMIADEATTALDVTVQAQVLKLLNDLKAEIGSSIILITHDMGVVAETCDWVTVMYAGTSVESCATAELFAKPRHPYTAGLLYAVPKLHERRERFPQIRGSVPNLISPPTGCRFHPRCDYATEECKQKKPELREISPGHWVACHHPLEE